jgi:hypothetical protein
MLAVGSVMAVAIHSAAVVAASAHWVSASEVAVVTFEIDGATLKFASVAG